MDWREKEANLVAKVEERKVKRESPNLLQQGRVASAGNGRIQASFLVVLIALLIILLRMVVLIIFNLPVPLIPLGLGQSVGNV
eukprot:3616975-Karenia_brevis.AAC.1